MGSKMKVGASLANSTFMPESISHLIRKVELIHQNAKLKKYRGPVLECL